MINIYILERNEIQFYVGKAKNAVKRKHSHYQKYGNDITLTIIDKVEDWKEIAQAMRKEYFPKRPALNMKRDTEEMSTSSQTVMNLTDRILQITYFKGKVNEFKGINRQLPEGYQPKITIEVIPV